MNIGTPEAIGMQEDGLMTLRTATRADSALVARLLLQLGGSLALFALSRSVAHVRPSSAA